MKNRLQGMVVGFLAAVVMMNTFAHALTGTRNIEVNYGNYKIVIDGEEITPRDANGNIVEPFGYNGAIYLPLRALGTAFNKEMSWDSATGTAYIGKKPSGAVFTTAVPPYEVNYAKMAGSVTMAGTIYHNAMTYYNLSGSYSLHNLNGQYTKLTGYVGHVDKTDMRNVTLHFYGDGKLLASYELKAQDLPKPVSLDLTGVMQLKIGANLHLSTTYAFAGGIIE
jgi:hypothetical protein